MQVRSVDQEEPLEKEMATHSSIHAWRSPWTQEPRGLQSTGWHRVRHDRARTECCWAFVRRGSTVDGFPRAQEAVCGFSQHLVNSPRVCQTATPVPLLFSFPVALSPPGKESRMPWSCHSWHWFRSSDWERALRTRAEKRNRRGDELSKQNSH